MEARAAVAEATAKADGRRGVGRERGELGRKCEMGGRGSKHGEYLDGCFCDDGGWSVSRMEMAGGRRKGG